MTHPSDAELDALESLWNTWAAMPDSRERAAAAVTLIDAVPVLLGAVRQARADCGANSVADLRALETRVATLERGDALKSVAKTLLKLSRRVGTVETLAAEHASRLAEHRSDLDYLHRDTDRRLHELESRDPEPFDAVVLAAVELDYARRAR